MVRKTTHIVFGVGSAIYLCSPPPHLLMWCGVFAFLGSIIPDFDLKHKHRMLLHNVFSFVAITLILAIMLKLSNNYNLYYMWAFIIGYLSHLFSDMFTKAGVALFYPISNSRARIIRLRYDNPLINILFIIIGVILIAKYVYDVVMAR